MSTYRFNKHLIGHHFHPVRRGTLRQRRNEEHSIAVVNGRCLEDVEPHSRDMCCVDERSS